MPATNSKQYDDTEFIAGMSVETYLMTDPWMNRQNNNINCPLFVEETGLKVYIYIYMTTCEMQSIEGKVCIFVSHNPQGIQIYLITL
jgi:hypothetical protein